MEISLPFILQVRRICETIFDMMLCAYISSLKTLREQSEGRGTKMASKGRKFDEWDQALQSAETAW